MVPTQSRLNQTRWSLPPAERRGRGAESEKTLDNSRQKILGIILIVTGIYFLLDRLFPRWNLIHYWPTWLIILGLYLLYQGVRPAK